MNEISYQNSTLNDCHGFVRNVVHKQPDQVIGVFVNNVSPTNPVDVFHSNKATAEKLYHLLPLFFVACSRVVRSCILRNSFDNRFHRYEEKVISASSKSFTFFRIHCV